MKGLPVKKGAFVYQYTPAGDSQQEHLSFYGKMALDYADAFGWLAIPARAKIPLVKWNGRDLPTFPDRATLRAWWRRFPAGQLALVTGARSLVVVIDADPRHGGSLEAFYARGWPRVTPTARSGGCVAGDGGGHAYYQYPADGQPVPSAPRYAPGCEVKADGAIVILPPSLHHATRRQYRWLDGLSPWDVPLAPLPDAVIAELRARQAAHATASHAYDVIDPTEHVYEFDDTVELVTILLNTALRKIDAGEHRNNVAVWLGLQLGTLRLTRQELIALGDLYERTVRHVR